jgi:DNA mismatch repair ATPase MutS
MGLNEVFKKVADIERNATELASHKVDLALMGELATAVKQAKDVAGKYSKSKDKISKAIASIKDDIAALKLNKDYGKKVLTNASKFKGQLDKLSKELGTPLQGSEPDKLLSELFMLGEDVQGTIDDALSMLNTIK